MLSHRPTRLFVYVALIAFGLVLIAVRLGVGRTEVHETGTPMDIEWSDGVGWASIAEGEIRRLVIDGDELESAVVASGLAYPRGIARIGDMLFVAELGELPCENPVPRCKGEHVDSNAADGERALIASSSGRVLAFPITSDGLGEPAVLVDELPFVNTDHGLNDLEAGPDGMLYLAVGNLDRLAWDDGGDPPTGPKTEWLGTILRIDPADGSVEVFARGLRNVFGLAFDDAGGLWGVDNDGPGRGPWRFEELLAFEPGLDYGFPDDGTTGPYQRRTGFATWIMPVGAGSSGLLVHGGEVLSGGCGMVTRVRLTTDTGDANVRTADFGGCLTAIAELPDGRLIIGAVLGEDAFRVTTPDALLGG